jgi:hypothetical protein
VKIINHSAMTQLTRGLGTRHDWDYISTALNIAIVLAELGVGHEYLEQIKNAMWCHAQCGKRFYTHGKVGYSGPELSVVNLALEVHDAQVDAATVGEMEKAHIEVSRRLRNNNITHKVKEEA